MMDRRGGARPTEKPADSNSGEIAQRGRPGTRPSDRELRILARAHAASAVAALAAVMTDPQATPAARVSAASALLNWGYRKARPDRDEPNAARVVRLVWGGSPSAAPRVDDEASAQRIIESARRDTASGPAR